MPPSSPVAVKGFLRQSFLGRYSSLLQYFVPRALRQSTLRSTRQSRLPASPPLANPLHAPNQPRLASVLGPATSATAAVLALSSMAAVYSTTVTKAAAGPVPDDAAAKAHHVKSHHGHTTHFHNPHPSAGAPFTGPQMFRMFMKARWNGEVSFPSTDNANIPQVKPTFLPTRSNAPAAATEHPPAAAEGAAPATSSPGAMRATWLGHACYYVEFPSGLRVLFDPVFEPCCSPPPASWFGFPKRFTPPPAVVNDLPFVDAVVISHSHYDHLSLHTVRAVVAKHPEAHFFVGLGLEKWFRASGITRVTELDWWEDAQVKLVATPKSTAGNEAGAGEGPKEIEATFSCLPCQHTSARSALDKDTTLWCSWGVASGGKSVFFGGDTGYRHVPRLPAGEDDYGAKYDHLPRNPDFKKIGQFRGPFDLGLIPIGAYKPRYLFSGVHASPFDAVEIFKDTACRRGVGIHWGTWVLTSEDVDEPPKMLKDALKRSGIPEEGVFDVVALGESREF